MNQASGTRDENRRRAYLKLMGIQPLYAKLALKNARSSPVYPELSETGAREQTPAVPESAPPAAREAAPGPKPAQEPQPAPEPKPAREPAAAVTRKPLHYLRIDDSLALLAEDGWEGADGAKCRDLLANILKALGKTLDGGAAGELAHLNSESAEANAGRGDLLENLCERDRCGNLLIFAFNGSELFPDVSSPIADFARTIGGVSLRVTVTRGLREMLAFPGLKKYCWRDLQRLRARLR